MSEVLDKTQGKQKPSKSKKDLDDSTPKGGKGEPKAKTGSKKELDPKDSERDGKDVKNQEDKSKGDTKQGTENSKESTGKDEGKDPKKQQQEILLTEEMETVFKNITEEFNSLSAFFTKTLKDTMKAMSEKGDLRANLVSQHAYFRAHEQLAKSCVQLIKQTYKTVEDSSHALEETLKRMTSVKKIGPDEKKDKAEIEKRNKELLKQIETAFKKKCSEESAMSKREFETVTAAGLGKESETRLLSAKLHIRNQSAKEELQKEEEDHKVALKRVVVEGLRDKTFVAHKSFAVLQTMRREEASRENQAFREYVGSFDLKPGQDIMLKGMGRGL